MELVYLWIENYRDFIIKQGFNFSSKYRFDYNSETGVLNVEKNPNYIQDFFNINEKSSSKISNITAIIGENGTGKSTILDFIRVSANSYDINRSIFVFKRKEKYCIYYHPKMIKLKINTSLEQFKLRSDIKKFKQLAVVMGRPVTYGIRIKDISFIFFSNIFDIKKHQLGGDDLYNLSTNFLLKKDKRNAQENGITNYKDTESKIHRISEIYRQIKLVNKYSMIKNRDKIPFKMPTKIELSLIELNINIHTEKDIYEKAGCLNFINKIREEFKNEKKFKLNNKNYKLELYQVVLENFLYDYLSNFILTINEKIFDIDELKGEDIFDKVINLFNNILVDQEGKVVANELAKSEINPEENYVEWIKAIINFLKFINKILEKENLITTGRKLIISFDQEDKNLEQSDFKKLINYHEDAIRNSPIFNFDWRDLSSGEKALLNIYSRFYSIVNPDLKKNLLILIDEGELYLHPQWQKKFLYNLIEFLPEIYPNKKIQIILTSHSPFVASDLSSSNIIFLKKDKDGKCKVVDGLEENNRTFASNIHTLFSDSFFMKDGLMGDFAKHKINELIKLLVNGDISEIKENKDYIKSSINIIGEPVIRTKLLNMLKEKLEVDLISIDERIKTLEEELEELKRKKEND